MMELSSIAAAAAVSKRDRTKESLNRERQRQIELIATMTKTHRRTSHDIQRQEEKRHPMNEPASYS
jgi:hypothetical protein